MLQLFFLLIIGPSLIGCWLKTHLSNKVLGCSLFYFALGFLIMAAEFALICYPAICFNTPFHIVCYLSYGFYVFQSLAILIWLIIAKPFNLKHLFNKECILNYLHYPVFWIMILICGFQICRLIFFAPATIRDSKTYNALIVDILQSDRLFLINPADGFPIESVLDMRLKFVMSPWYPFNAMLAKLSGQHHLIISNTVLPAYILLMHYIILFSLGYCLFRKRNPEVYLFTALCAIIQEVTLYCHTPTMISLVWPAWGKGVLSMTVVPAILVIYMLYIDQSSNMRTIVLLFILALLIVAGCSMSTMAAVALPLETGLLGLIWAIRKRSVRLFVCAIASCAPALMYLATYYYLSTI